ncbi:MAG: membrane protein insertion efficiency factor YidD [Spirochaetes bacterium]|nr:MAG: membrane protein insertion efficiency factor YidD [Spirochaetota bacterium]
MKFFRYLFMLPIFLYRNLLSPVLPPSCIYTPTCSQYAMDSLHHHGVLKGLLLATARVFRCTNLFFKGGEDPVPKEFSFHYIKDSYSKFKLEKN